MPNQANPQTIYTMAVQPLSENGVSTGCSQFRGGRGISSVIRRPVETNAADFAFGSIRPTALMKLSDCKIPIPRKRPPRGGPTLWSEPSGGVPQPSC